MNKIEYRYAIVNFNNTFNAKESTLGKNDYLDTKYAIIIKVFYSDGTEQIDSILYSDDIEYLTNEAKKYITWYNYVTGISKSISGYISTIRTI